MSNRFGDSSQNEINLQICGFICDLGLRFWILRLLCFVAFISSFRCAILGGSDIWWFGFFPTILLEIGSWKISQQHNFTKFINHEILFIKKNESKNHEILTLAMNNKLIYLEIYLERRKQLF